MSLFVPKDRRSLFRQFLTGMYDAVIIADPNGHILDVNPRAVEHFGRDLDELPACVPRWCSASATASRATIA